MQTQNAFSQKTVTQIVREDYRTADVFKQYGINYCCGGNLPLVEACAARQLSLNEVTTALQKAVHTLTLPAGLQFGQWKPDFLADYIVNVHHAYLKETLPRLEASLLHFAGNHRKKLPQLDEVLQQFQQLKAVLEEQTTREETVIFPYIKQVAAAYRNKESYGSLFVKTLRKPLQQAAAANDVSGALSALRSLTNGYGFGEDACTTHRVVFQHLQAFDNDLVQHKHLENNVLFPQAVEMEAALLKDRT